MSKEISQAVIRRMPRYYRYLGELLDEGVERISSNELSARMKVTASQIRQDLNNFGGFGQQGYGYNVQFLYEEIGKIMGLNEQHNIIIIGAGNLGQALANYVKFEKLGFVIVGLFDVNPELCGKSIRGNKIEMIDKLEEFVKTHKVDIATLTMPKEKADAVANQLVSLGVHAIWNFAHVDLEVLDENVVVENVHLSDSLMQLSYDKEQKEKGNAGIEVFCMKDDKEFLEALESRKVPILVLDQKWHRLFALSGKTSEIKQLEEKLNQLLEQQGKLNNDLKELKKTKNRLMKSIVVNMEGTHEENEGDISSRKLDEDKRLIDEVNVKMEEIEDELIELPRNINSANQELMLESMRYCYERLRQNSKEADEITAWIDKVRVELKKNIIKKQNREINNRQIYSYMHDIFGVDILNIFDLRQEDEDRLQGKKAVENADERN